MWGSARQWLLTLTSVYWKAMQGEELSEKDKEEILRVKNEPMSILE